MKPELRLSPFRPRAARRRLTSGLLAAIVVAGCAPLEAGPGALGDPPALGAARPDAAQSAIAYYVSTRGYAAADLARERTALAGKTESPATQLRLAMLLGQPRGGTNLPRALTLLDAVLAAGQPEARALHPVARLLADQIQERQRLEATAERLTQQLERTGQQLRESQRHGDQLKEKLDALTEIERTLPARPPATAVPPAVPPERRLPQ
jgi:hypothetical protein